MRSLLRDNRAVSEVVGTLMLVVIVITAATLLAAFVSAYEKQVLAEENQQHDRSLETGRVSGVQICSPTSCGKLYCYEGKTPAGASCTGQSLPTLTLQAVDGGASDDVVNVSFVSGDVQSLNLSAYEVDGQTPQGWMFFPHGATPGWMSDPAEDVGWDACQPTTTYNGSIVPANASCSEVSAYQQVNITLILGSAISTPSSPVSLDMYTSLSVEFSYEFIPPVPIIQTTVLPVGTAYEPLFDGADSYQPAGGDNATIVTFSWTIDDQTTPTNPPITSYTGPEIEVSQLSSSETSDTYLVTLTVVNSDGLSTSTSVVYSS